MKTKLQILFFLCFSITSFAQKMTCEELMKLPLGKYLYANDNESLASIINNLENCGIEKYELDLSLLSIFIANVAGEKDEAATVQDLYDEILIFRRQNDSEAAKIHSEMEQTYYKKYSTEIITKENFITSKTLISNVFGFDENNFEAFVNPLFEAEGDKLTINYSVLLKDYETHLKEKYNLSKIAKKENTDFDFGANSYLFPSMDYFKRREKAKTSNKLILLYFYGYGVANCENLNETSFHNPALCKLVDSNFTFITLAIDSGEKLPETHQYKQFLEEVSEKNIYTVGQYNAAIQRLVTFTDSQPYFVVLDNFGHIILKIDYEIAKNPVFFVEKLKKVLR